MKFAASHKDYRAVCALLDSIKTPKDFYEVIEKLRRYDGDVVRAAREDKQCYNAAQYAE